MRVGFMLFQRTIGVCPKLQIQLLREEIKNLQTYREYVDRMIKKKSDRLQQLESTLPMTNYVNHQFPPSIHGFYSY